MVAVALLHGGTFSWSEWVLYPDFLGGWLIFGAAYLLIAGPLRRFFPGSEPVPASQLALFSAGMLLMLGSLQGPLHELSDYFLFSAHMVQHLLVMLVMPPLLMMGTPGWMLRPLLRIPGLAAVARVLTRPVVAFLLVNILFGVWHFPGPYDLMMRDHLVHKGMHLMIMSVGMVLWWPVMSPLPEIPRIPGPLQMLYLFVLGIPMMVVAIVIVFGDREFYPWYAQAPRIFPLSVLEDQRLGALIMWVPGALVMWLGITFAYFRWSRREIREDQTFVGIDRPGESGVLIAAPPFPESSIPPRKKRKKD
ncbi:MAG: cytochrome c oxidase assembly protein [Gemmatimonadota bacterium]|jgi:putative membrane protein|nr:cytochrome c oxidase assembly protein [Gemmatimonadota bacterium]